MRLLKITEEIKKRGFNYWWIKVPVILFCVLVVVGGVLGTELARAATSIDGFADSLQALIESMRVTQENIIELFKVIYP